MEILVKLNSSTAGRDKLARLIQYGSRALWYLLEERKRSLETSKTLKEIDSILSTFRRLLRFGRCIDVLYGALHTMHNPDMIVRLTCTMSRIAQALFLLGDHLLWLGRANLMQVDSQKWARTSCKYWLYSIILNLVRDFYELWHVFQENRQKKEGSKALIRGKDLMYMATCYVREHRDVVVDTVKNACDLFIPLTMLGHTKLSPGTIGILGVMSSMAGLLAMMDPASKLTPT